MFVNEKYKYFNIFRKHCHFLFRNKYLRFLFLSSAISFEFLSDNAGEMYAATKMTHAIFRNYNMIKNTKSSEKNKSSFKFLFICKSQYQFILIL